jgi:hypothetical protein
MPHGRIDSQTRSVIGVVIACKLYTIKSQFICHALLGKSGIEHQNADSKNTYQNTNMSTGLSWITLAAMLSIASLPVADRILIPDI